MFDFLEGLPENIYIVGDSAFRGHPKIKITENIGNMNTEPFILNGLKKLRIVFENCFGIYKKKFGRFRKTIVNGESEKKYKNILFYNFSPQFYYR